MAGLAALYETDIKKVVALSTLSQLGVMMTRIGATLYTVAFFHIICHAFFKALLFLTVGNMIHISNDYQDIRKTGIIAHFSPLTLAFRLGANVSLCGLPFTRGFYSKDLCIEIVANQGGRGWLLGVFYFATALTAAYTTRLIWLTQLTPQTHRLATRVERDSAINFSICILFPLAIRGGS